MHEDPPQIRRKHGATPDRATKNRRSVIGIHSQHVPINKPPQGAFTGSPPSADTVLHAPRVDRRNTRRSSDYSPRPHRAPPTPGPSRSRRHSMAEIPPKSNGPIQVSIRFHQSSPPRPSDGNSKTSEKTNQNLIKRRSFIGRRLHETRIAHNRESETSEFCQYSQSCADEQRCSAAKHNFARICKDKLKWSIERRVSISSGHDTKCSSSSESNGSRDAMFRRGDRVPNDLMVRRLSLDDASIYGPSFTHSQVQLDSLNSVVTQSDSRIHARPKFAPMPPGRVHRSRSMEVSSNHGMISSDNAPKIMRLSSPTTSQAQSTGTSSSRKSESTCFPTTPPPRPLSHSKPRGVSMSDGVTRRRCHADTIHCSRSCIVDSELIGGCSKFSCADKNVPAMKRPSLTSQIPETADTKRHANEFKIANKKILDKLNRSNQVTSMPYTDTMGESGLYTGEIDRESRLPHGRGKMKYENGIFYEGKWVNGAQDVQAAIQRERILSGFTSWKGKSGKDCGGNNSSVTTKVYGLKWVDFYGMPGKYTGAINKDDVPHGYGKLCYDFGLIAEGNWVHGVLDDGAGMAAVGASMGMGIGGCDATVFGGALTPRSDSRSVFEEGTAVSGLGVVSVGGTGGMGVSVPEGSRHSMMLQSTQPGFAYHAQSSGIVKSVGNRMKNGSLESSPNFSDENNK